MIFERFNISPSNLPDFYNFYKILNEVDLSKQEEEERESDVFNIPRDAKVSVADLIISLNEMKDQIKLTTPDQIICIKGAAGQGKTEGVIQTFEEIAASKNKKIIKTTSFWGEFAGDHAEDKQFEIDFKQLAAKIAFGDVEKTPKENPKLADLKMANIKSADTVFNLLRILIAEQYNPAYTHEIKDFFEKYITKKYYVYAEMEPGEDVETFIGLPSLISTENPYTGSKDVYEISIKGAKWYPLMIFGMEGGIFFDEITRYRQDVLDSFTTFFTSDNPKDPGGKMLLQKFPVSSKVKIVCAGNFGKGYNVSTLDQAMQGRMIFLDLNVTPDDFYSYVLKTFDRYESSNVDELPDEFIPKKWDELGAKIKLLSRNLNRLQTSSDALHEFQLPIDPELYKTAAAVAFDKFKWIIRTRPELFMEDKNYSLSLIKHEENKSETAGRANPLLQRGYYNIAKNPEALAQRKQQKNVLSNLFSVSEIDAQRQTASEEAYKLVSQNRQMFAAFARFFIPAQYAKTALIEARKKNLDVDVKYYTTLFNSSIRAAKAQGSPDWMQAVSDVLEKKGIYTAETFRSVISRYNVPPENAQSLFDKVEPYEPTEEHFPKKGDEVDFKKTILGGLQYEELIREYKLSNNFNEDSKFVMDFCILMNSLKYYFNEKSSLANDTIKSTRMGLISKIKGDSDESKKKFVEFMLDYCFMYRPKDAAFVLLRVMDLTVHIDAQQRRVFESFTKQLSTRQNHITDEEIAAAEFKVKAQKRDKTPVKPQEQSESETI
jgi:hypothetical protein